MLLVGHSVTSTQYAQLLTVRCSALLISVINERSISISFFGGKTVDSISIFIFRQATDCFDYARVSVHLPEHPGAFVTRAVAVYLQH